MLLFDYIILSMLPPKEGTRPGEQWEVEGKGDTGLSKLLQLIQSERVNISRGVSPPTSFLQSFSNDHRVGVGDPSRPPRRRRLTHAYFQWTETYRLHM